MRFFPGIAFAIQRVVWCGSIRFSAGPSSLNLEEALVL